jgi:hypothetical protein
MLLIITPFTFVNRPIEMSIDAFTVRFVIFPLSLVDVAI